jgi:murein DD-endopeptidase MepM/ murein hydrolase activator NlpD
MSFDSPITDFLADKVSYVMEYNVEINDIFGKISSLTNMLKKSTDKKENGKQKDQGLIDISGSEDSSVLASAPVYQFQGEDFPQIDYGGKVEEVELDPQEDNKANIGEKNNQEGTAKDKANVKFIVPANAPLGSKFGERLHPIKGKVEMHKGIDIKANYGAPIKAAMAGKVIEAGPNSSFGNMVKIDHQNGYITLYAHCSVIVTKKGEMVKQGDVISKVGSTGTSTGPHLHFEIWKNGTPVNPLDYVKIG